MASLQVAVFVGRSVSPHPRPLSRGRGVRVRPEPPFGVRQTRLSGGGIQPELSQLSNAAASISGRVTAMGEMGRRTVGYVSQSQPLIATLEGSRAI